MVFKVALAMIMTLQKSISIKEEEINDNTLVKDLKKLENQLNRIISQERKLVDLHWEDSIDEEVYTKKYKKLTRQKEELLDEKKTLELTIKDESFIKERLKQFKKILENKEIIEEFNRTVIESIVDNVVGGRIDKDGTVHPYDLTFYFKTGIKDSQDSNNFKDKRKNAKDNDIDKLYSYKNDEDKKLCSQAKDNARWSPSPTCQEAKLHWKVEAGLMQRFPKRSDRIGSFDWQKSTAEAVGLIQKI